jgi:hypothetical protein
LNGGIPFDDLLESSFVPFDIFVDPAGVGRIVVQDTLNPFSADVRVHLCQFFNISALTMQLDDHTDGDPGIAYDRVPTANARHFMDVRFLWRASAVFSPDSSHVLASYRALYKVVLSVRPDGIHDPPKIIT